MTTVPLHFHTEYFMLNGMDTRLFKQFAISLISVLSLFFIFKYMLFNAIGWHDGLVLDWYQVYYPAIQTIDPFSAWGYFNPPWLAWILSPLGILSASESHVLWIVLILLLTIKCVYSMGGNALSVVLTIVSPGFIITIVNGQVDIFVLIGLIIGSWLFILVKPQVAGMTVFYDIIANKRIDWKSVFVIIVCILVWCFMLSMPDQSGLNTSVGITYYPYSIPFGIILFALSIIKKDKWLAAVSTFCFAPYLSGSSLLVYSAIGTSKYGKIFAVLFSVALWVVTLHWFI